MTENSLVLFVLKAGKYHFIRRRLEYGHLAHGWTIILESNIGGVNLRYRHHKAESLLASFVPKPTQGLQVSIASAGPGRSLYGPRGGLYSRDKDLGLSPGYSGLNQAEM